MKATTRQWLDFAKADLITCESILSNEFLTNILVFHAQQTVEKCFKAIIEENGGNISRIHDLTRLFHTAEAFITFDIDIELQNILDGIYTTARYPVDLGLLPEGKPSSELANQLYEYAKYIYDKTAEMMS